MLETIDTGYSYLLLGMIGFVMIGTSYLILRSLYFLVTGK